MIKYPFVTYTGKCIDITNIQVDDIDIVDIAHSLSLQCRFGGHLSEFYSVAQHSMRVAMALPKQYRFVGLMHDATETYIMDLPRPIKVLMPIYQELEQRVWEVIAKQFKLPKTIPNTVMRMDDAMLAIEARELTLIKFDWESKNIHNLQREPPKPSYQAKMEFLQLFSAFQKG